MSDRGGDKIGKAERGVGTEWVWKGDVSATKRQKKA